MRKLLICIEEVFGPFCWCAYVTFVSVLSCFFQHGMFGKGLQIHVQNHAAFSFEKTFITIHRKAVADILHDEFRHADT